MIVGIGNDIIELERIVKVISRNGFVEKYFTEAEHQLFTERKMNPSTIGGNFAVKESVSKALGSGIRDFGLKDIEVLRDELGKPYINLYGKAKVLAETLGIQSWHVAISHSRSVVTAMAIGEK